MAAQLRLNLEHEPSYAREAFIVSPSNRTGVAAVDSWPSWIGGALVLVGPTGSGKTHLALSWARAVLAVVLPPGFGAAEIAALRGPALLEDADRRPHGEALFHLINMAARPGFGLLVTARSPPGQWLSKVPDLRSRLNALPVAELHEPDDAVLTGVLAKFFQERNIRPSEDLLSYLVRRIERSAPHAREIVARLDEVAAQQSRPVSRALAREVLDDDNREEDRPA